ncbi:putative RNA-directed DNA polymerase [Senna tora]|uniref:Putative RNA-directed DNA polymerase n=1 Tax=Senna tora TaxID=362788 RepID=A0A834WZW4_9FABA|nr:putative RNA-directed DNA polymerase [Senna tora]
MEPRPAALTEQSSEADKAYHKQWHDSNRICLTVLKYKIEKNIRQSIPEKENATEFLKAISDKYKKFEKSQKAYYLSFLDNTRILESLPAEYGVLRTTYNSQECEWSIDQIISIVVQEEESQKNAKSLTQSVNNLTLGSSSKSGNEKGKGKKFDKKKKSFGPKKNDFKVKGKGKIKEGFKGECFYCKKSRHRIADCFKLKKKNEKEAGLSGSRGSRFYCPSHSTRVIESDRAFYFENDSDSGSEAPRTVKLHNEDTLLIMPSIPSSSTTHVPTRAHDNIEVPVDVNPTDYVQDEQVIEPPINEV